MQVDDHPILMRPELIRMTLDDIKTETRRIINPQPQETPSDIGYAWKPKSGTIAHSTFPTLLENIAANSPYGIPGDLLWVRENFQYQRFDEKTLAPIPDRGAFYAATDDMHIRWRPSIHMPRQFNRLTLEIKDIVVERIQDITGAGARREGVTIPINAITGAILLRVTGKFPPIDYISPATLEAYKSGRIARENPEHITDDLFRAHFASLWDQLNHGRGFGWHKNPWVWVIKYKAHKMNVDQLKQQRAA